MILEFANGTPEQMTTSLMESVQRSLETRDRKLSSIEQVTLPDLETRIKTIEDSNSVIIKKYKETNTISANGNKLFTYSDIAVDDYEPLSVAEIEANGTNVDKVFLYGWDFNSDKDSLNVGARNTHSSSVTVSFTVSILYIAKKANAKVPPQSGGGGGTSDYNDLNNKPQINSNSLTGNKSSSSLGLADAIHTHVMADVTDLETVTELRDGIMTALDKQKLDGIASGAEVNVQSDWNQATNTADDYIKNKPTIPSKVSDLLNDSGFITGYTETDPVFSASAAAGITSSDISSWDDKSEVSINKKTTTGTNIADITIDGVTTQLYAPTSGGGGVTDYDQLSSRPQINSTTLTGDKSSADLGLAAAVHTHSQYLTGNGEVLYDNSSGWTPSTSSGATVDGKIANYSLVEVHLSDGSFGVCNLSWSNGTGVILGMLAYPYNEYIYVNSVNFQLTKSGSNYTLTVPSATQVPANYRIGTSVLKVTTVRKLTKIVGLVASQG